MSHDEQNAELALQQRRHEELCSRDFQTAVTFWAAGLRPWDGSGDRPDPYELVARKFAYEYFVGHWDCPGLIAQPMGWSFSGQGIEEATEADAEAEAPAPVVEG